MSTDPLSIYRAKRSPDRTPEPFGTGTGATGRLFVVHQHAARRLHFDLRLEWDGVLHSWAVPKGPSYDTAEKRLAVHVEDHPLEYGDFEGMIPEGNYGAGAVIVWDRGEWVPLEDPKEGLAKGKLLFELKGYKLHGRWTLVKLKKSVKDWLLIKERDAWAKPGGEELPPESVLSGLTVDDLKAGRTPAAMVRAELERLGAPRRKVKPSAVEPMLAEPRDEAFTKEGWLFELKLDGYRLLASRAGGRVELRSRNGNDLSATFPEVTRAVEALPVESVILDGEVVVLDAQGKPSFQGLQKRGRIQRALDVRRAAIESPATYFAFDLVAFEDFDVRPLPLIERKQLLRRLLPPLGPVRYLDHVETEGEAFLGRVVAMGLEGVVAKRADSPYRTGRSSAWLKIRSDKTDDFVVVGFTTPRGTRGGFGALQLADYVGDKLVYAGRAGSGFTGRELDDLRATLEQSKRDTPPCYGPLAPGATEPAETIPQSKDTTWVEPRLVCEVRFKEWTEEGLLRQPVFLRLRDDKRPEECVRQDGRTLGPDDGETVGRDDGRTVGEQADDPPAVSPSSRPSARREPLQLTNVDKVFWPDEGYTKGDLLAYYREISPWLLPYLRDRPVVMTRFPDGIKGKSFYQKDAPDFAPKWIRTVPIWSEDTQRDISYFVCDDLDSLLYIVNLGTIPLHVWASRVGSLERPDWCVIDLDPKEAPFSDVLQVAGALHRLCQEVELPNLVKTTGKTGLHIMIPLGRQCTYEQSRALGELLSRIVIRELPDISTITRVIQKRGTKVYLDYMQNRHGQLIVAPFSVRPLPGATVSMPLEWKEVNARLDPAKFTIKTAPARMQKLGRDPLAPVLELKPDLPQVLERLAGRFSP